MQPLVTQVLTRPSSMPHKPKAMQSWNTLSCDQCKTMPPSTEHIKCPSFLSSAEGVLLPPTTIPNTIISNPISRMRTPAGVSVYQQCWPRSCFQNYSAPPSFFSYFKVMMRRTFILKLSIWCSGAPQHCLSQERVRQEGPVLANTMVNTQEVLSNSMINTEGEWLQLIERMLSWSWDCKTLIPNISQRLFTRTFLRSWRMSPSPTAGRPSSNVKWTTSGTTRSVLICKRFHHLKPFRPHKDFPWRIWNWKTFAIFCQGLKKCSND